MKKADLQSGIAKQCVVSFILFGIHVQLTYIGFKRLIGKYSPYRAYLHVIRPIIWTAALSTAGHIIRKILFRVRPWFRGFLLTSLWGCNIILIWKKSTTTLDDKQVKYICNIGEIVSEVRPLFPVDGRPSYPFVSPPTFEYSKVANTLH